MYHIFVITQHKYKSNNKIVTQQLTTNNYMTSIHNILWLLLLMH